MLRTNPPGTADHWEIVYTISPTAGKSGKAPSTLQCCEGTSGWPNDISRHLASQPITKSDEALEQPIAFLIGQEASPTIHHGIAGQWEESFLSPCYSEDQKTKFPLNDSSFIVWNIGTLGFVESPKCLVSASILIPVVLLVHPK